MKKNITAVEKSVAVHSRSGNTVDDDRTILVVVIEQAGRETVDQEAGDLPDTVHDQIPSSSQAMVDPSDESGQVKLTLILKNNSDRTKRKKLTTPLGR
jgi:hypothetical protein